MKVESKQTNSRCQLLCNLGTQTKTFLFNTYDPQIAQISADNSFFDIQHPR